MRFFFKIIMFGKLSDILFSFKFLGLSISNWTDFEFNLGIILEFIFGLSYNDFEKMMEIMIK